MDEEFDDAVAGGDETAAAEAEAQLLAMADGQKEEDDDFGDDTAPAKPVVAAAPKKEVDSKADATSKRVSSDVKALEKQIEKLTQQVAEREESEKYWAGQARKLAEGRDEKPGLKLVEDEPDPYEKETAEELIQAIGTKGLAALKERGFKTQKEMASEIRRIASEEAKKYARQEVEQTKAGLTRDAEIMGRFPDLKDHNSDFFKEAKEQLKVLVAARPGVQPDSDMLERAAERAETVLLRRQIASKDKQSRIAQQMPSRGERGGSEADEAEPITLGPAQLAVIKGMGISKADYMKNFAKGKAS